MGFVKPAGKAVSRCFATLRFTHPYFGGFFFKSKRGELSQNNKLFQINLLFSIFQTVTLLLQEELTYTECSVDAKQCDTLPTAQLLLK